MLSDEEVIEKTWIKKTKVDRDGYFATDDAVDITELQTWDYHNTPNMELIAKFSDTQVITARKTGKRYTYYLPNKGQIHYLQEYHKAEIAEARDKITKNNEIMDALKKKSYEKFQEALHQIPTNELIVELTERYIPKEVVGDEVVIEQDEIVIKIIRK